MKRLSINLKLCCVVATAVITSCSSGMTDSKVLDEKIKKDAKEKMNIDLECEWEIIDQPIPFYIYKHKLILEEIK